MAFYIGCDLGGTNVKLGLVNVDDGEVLVSASIPTLAREGHEAVLRRITEAVNKLIAESGLEKEKMRAVGVSVPGELDMESGQTVFITNFPGKWKGVRVKDTLERALNLPVHMLNDARAITLGEFTFGAGRGVQDMVCFALGTGIGGGLVLDGKLVLGIRGTAGELGHMTVDVNGPPCGCGNHGCLEALASGPAIAAMAIKAVTQGRTTNIGPMVNHDLNLITPALVAEAAQAGDQIAKEIWDKAGHYLGTGIANLITTVSPRKVVLCGGVAAAGDLLLEPVRRTVAQRVFLVPLDEVEIVLGELGNDAGVLGTAQWAALQQAAKG